MIEVKNIWKTFGELEVLKGVNLKVEKGEIVAIIGKSGAGKTTLLQIIGTLDRPTSGQVLIEGEDVFALNDTKLAAFRNKHIGLSSSSTSYCRSSRLWRTSVSLP